MAGTGKGPLRIALADWWNTTLIGKAIAKVFHDAGEEIETSIFSEYSEIITKIQSITGLDKVLKINKGTTGKTTSQGGILSFGGFAAGVGSQAAASFLAPYMKLLNYEIDGAVKSARLDVGTAIAGLWRNPEFATLLNEDMQDLGWTADRLKVVTKISHPRVSNQELLTAMLRGNQTETYVRDEMAKRGYLPEDIDIMIKQAHLIPSPQDLISMAVREAFSPDAIRRFGYDQEIPGEASDWAKKQGLDPEWFNKFWYSHWVLPSAQMGFEMLHRLRQGTTNVPFTKDDLALLLKVLDYPVFWRERLAQISYQPYTRVDVRRMFKLGVVTKDQLVGVYQDLGYDPEHAKNMAEFTIRYETDAGGSKLDDYSNLSQSMAADLYNLKIITQEEYKNHLLALKADPRDIELIVQLTDLQRTLALTPDRTKEFAKDMQDILLNAYSLKILGPDETKSMLSDAGMPANQAELALAAADYDYAIKQQNDYIKALGDGYINHSFTRSDMITRLGKINIPSTQQQQIMLEYDQARSVRTRRLTETGYTNAFKNKLLSLEGWIDAMEGLGYSDPDIALLQAALEKGINI